MLKFAAAIALTLAATAPAFAQVGATQSPPAPNASSQAPQPTNSLPAGASTMNPATSPNAAGASVKTTPVAPAK